MCQSASPPPHSSPPSDLLPHVNLSSPVKLLYAVLTVAAAVLLRESFSFSYTHQLVWFFGYMLIVLTEQLDFIPNPIIAFVLSAYACRFYVLGDIFQVEIFLRVLRGSLLMVCELSAGLRLLREAWLNMQEVNKRANAEAGARPEAALKAPRERPKKA